MRPAFDNLNTIVDLRFFVLVVSVTDSSLAYDLAIKWVPNFTWHFHPQGLRRFCTGDNTNQCLFQRITLFQASISRSRKIVRILAIPRRNCMRLGPVSS